METDEQKPKQLKHKCSYCNSNLVAHQIDGINPSGAWAAWGVIRCDHCYLIRFSTDEYTYGKVDFDKLEQEFERYLEKIKKGNKK